MITDKQKAIISLIQKTFLWYAWWSLFSLLTDYPKVWIFWEPLYLMDLRALLSTLIRIMLVEFIGQHVVQRYFEIHTKWVTNAPFRNVECDVTLCDGSRTNNVCESWNHTLSGTQKT